MEENSNLKAHLAEIDERKAELELNVQLGKDLEALHNIPEFQRVILSAYLEKEAERLFGVLVNPSTLKRDVMENIVDKTGSIRNLKQFFGVLLQNAHMAPEQIAEEEAYRKEVTASYADGSNPDADEE